MPKHKHKNGFTLLEILIYTGVSAVVLVLIMGINWDFMRNYRISQINSDLIHTGELLLDKITIDIHGADDLDESFSIFNDPGSLNLVQGVSDVLIEPYLKQINVNGQNITIRKIRRSKDGNTYDLTKDNVNISSFLLQDLSRDQNSHNINISIELEYIGTSNESLNIQPIQFQRSASIRNK